MTLLLAIDLFPLLQGLADCGDASACDVASGGAPLASIELPPETFSGRAGAIEGVDVPATAEGGASVAVDSLYPFADNAKPPCALFWPAHKNLITQGVDAGRSPPGPSSLHTRGSRGFRGDSPLT